MRQALTTILLGKLIVSFLEHKDSKGFSVHLRFCEEFHLFIQQHMAKRGLIDSEDHS